MTAQPSNNGSAAAPIGADTEVVVRPTRRRFSAEYKARIPEEADQRSDGKIRSLLLRAQTIRG